jgi:hypothetical protein
MFANPQPSICHLRAQPIHVVVVAFDGDDVRPIDSRSKNLRRLEIVRDEHVALKSEARGVRRDTACKIPGGRAPEYVEAQLDRLRRRDRHDSVLVRERRMVDRIVFDVQLRKAELFGETRRAPAREVEWKPVSGSLTGNARGALANGS